MSNYVIPLQINRALILKSRRNRSNYDTSLNLNAFHVYPSEQIKVNCQHMFVVGFFDDRSRFSERINSDNHVILSTPSCLPTLIGSFQGWSWLCLHGFVFNYVRWPCDSFFGELHPLSTIGERFGRSGLLKEC